MVFHDVWTPEGKPYATKYGIEAIPTQVFLDEIGKEFSRHVGYFPEEELVKYLKKEALNSVTIEVINLVYNKAEIMF